LLAACALALSGCASVYNLPANRPLLSPVSVHDLGNVEPVSDEDALLILSFSGGGTRAAAFSFGVLEELDRARVGAKKTLLDRIDFVSGVSGGSITAAYFGLKKRAALRDFRERFLLRNAEESLNTSVNLANIGRALGGGVNASQFPQWLDENLFDGATFDAFGSGQPPGFAPTVHVPPTVTPLGGDIEFVFTVMIMPFVPTLTTVFHDKISPSASSCAASF